MTEDEVCQYFGKKWKRHRSRLKKCLLVAIEEHDRENGSGEKMEMEFDETARLEIRISKISPFLEQIRKEYIQMKNSLDYKLQIYSTSSVTILNN